MLFKKIIVIFFLYEVFQSTSWVAGVSEYQRSAIPDDWYRAPRPGYT